MEQLRHISGQMNLDDSVEVISPKDFWLGRNISIHNNHNGNGKVSNIRGNVELTTGAGNIAVGSKWHGTIVDHKNASAYIFFYHATALNNKIVKISNNAITEVISGATLAFNENYPVIGGGIVGDLIYFTDGLNEPRVINVTRSWASYIEEDINLIRRPPLYAPTYTRAYDSGFGQNLIKDDDFQFALQYKYEDGQLSVLSPYTTLSRRNLDNENFNYVSLTFPTSESVPALVDEVRLCMRVGNTGTWQVVDKSTSAPHNFSFYNNTVSEVLPDTYLKPFELIPQVARAMEIAHNRLWLANYELGYDAPATINLTGSITADTTPISGSFTVYHMQVDKYEHTGAGGTEWEVTESNVASYSGYFIKGNDNLYYKVLADGTYSTPTTILADGVTMAYDDGYAYDAIYPLPADPYPFNGRTVIYRLKTNTTQATGVSIDISDYPWLANVRVIEASLSRNSPYQMGIIFYDASGRSCGVVTNSGMKISTGTDGKQFTLNWTLNDHLNIPSWATSYSILLTRNLRKSWFVEGFTSKMVYSFVNNEGAKTYSNSYDRDYQYIEFDISGFVESGEGYDYAEGDRIIIYDKLGVDYDLEIIGQDGNRIVVEIQNIGSFDPLAEPHRFEIYTPLKKDDDLIFYETGNVYPITGGQFSQTTGDISGDTYAILRDIYEINDFNTSTGEGTLTSVGADYCQSIGIETDEDENSVWNTDRGRPFIVDEIGAVSRSNWFRFSNQLIEGSSGNAMSEFEPLAEDSTPLENGDIQALKITKKAQKDGDVMLAIGSLNTTSIYINEQAFSTAEGTSFMITSAQVVGQTNTLKKGSGTLHPESVYEYQGDVYWYDQINRAFVRYSTNGVFPVSDYKAISYYEDQTELLSNGERVVTGYDPYYKTIVNTFETASETYKKTIAFNKNIDGFEAFYDYAQENYFILNGIMYSVSAGKVYRHNSTTMNNFNGTQYDSSIGVSFNDSPQIKKEYTVLSINPEENLLEYVTGVQQVKSGALSVDFTNRNGQATDLISTDFEVDESVCYGALLNDTNNGGYVDGDDIVSNTLQAVITMSSTSESGIYFTSMGFIPSYGHML